MASQVNNGVEEDNDIDDDENPILIHKITPVTNETAEAGNSSSPSPPLDAAPENITNHHHNTISHHHLKEEQEKGDTVQLLKQWIEQDKDSDRHQLLSLPMEARQYAGILPALKMQDGLLVRIKLQNEHLEVNDTAPVLPL